MEVPSRILALGHIPTWLDRALARHAKVDHSDGESSPEADGEYLCAVLSANEAPALIQKWRSDPRHVNAPLIAVASEMVEEHFMDALAAGADDVLFDHSELSVERRVAALRASGTNDGTTRGRALIVHPDAALRRRLGRPLFRSGLSLDFASSLDELGELGVAPDVAVIVSDGADDEVHVRARELLDDVNLPVVMIAAPDADPFSYEHRVEQRTASIPANAPAEHLLFVVNELMNPSLGEKRASPRILHAGLCTFRTAGELLPRYGATFNLSRSGLFIRTLDLPERGASVGLEIRPPASTDSVHLSGRIVWATVGGATPPGFAIELVPHACPTADLATYRECYQELLDARAPRTIGDPAATEEGPTKVLIVDDEPSVLRSFELTFRNNPDLKVLLAKNGEEALELFRSERPDAAVVDINLPDISGIGLLKAIRGYDESVPVIMSTGDPALETAIEAMELGAYRYILKPMPPAEVREIVTDAISMARLARFRRQAATVTATATKSTDEIDTLDATLTRAIAQLHPHFQPIVRWPAREVFAFEALARTTEPEVPHPGVLFDAAERLERLDEVGRRMRRIAAEPMLDHDALLFLNLHPEDLLDEELYASDCTLAQLKGRVVLEITERASLNQVADLRSRVTRLRELGYKIAVDDLGAGYAGLSAFVALQPDVAKLDMSLVRDVHESQTKQRLIRSMVGVCEELSITVIAEGVETVEELEVLCELGCEFFQGFLFARPGEPFPDVEWPS